jgi:beta-glucosidase
LAASIGPAVGQQTPAGGNPPYLNPALPIDQRVDDLVSRLTVEEKAAQFSSTAPAIPRLQIPAYNWWSEALHGVANQGTATVFPQTVGLAATFDEPLIHTMATVISTEARAKFHQWERTQAAATAGGNLPGSGGGIRPGPAGLDYWSPNINIFRDPRWGRGQETYGEDPFLTGKLGAAFVRGLQGDDPKYFKVISTPKHYAVHSGPEPSRHSIDVKVSLHDEEDTYLPAFREAIVEAKADSAMCAYNSINGQPACANQFLMVDTLRNAWKFNGYVTSDCAAVGDISNPAPRGHGFVPTLADAAAISLKRGDDLDCGADTAAYLKAIQTGLITEKEADINLKRLFKARFQLGMFDPPSMVKYQNIPFSENDSAANRELAKKVSHETMVLLKNDGTLPLKSSVKKIAIIGPLADSIPALEGNYNGTSSRYVTPLDGIKKQFPSAEVTYVPGTTFLRTPVAVPATAYRTESGQPGITAVYFKNKDLTGAPASTRVETQLGPVGGRGGGGGFGGGGGGSALPEGIGTEAGPDGAQRQTDFSARWTGTLTATETQRYSLSINGSGGVRVWVDGKQIIDNWTQPAAAGGFGGGRGAQQADPARTANVQMEKGKQYALKVEFFHSAQWERRDRPCNGSPP